MFRWLARNRLWLDSPNGPPQPRTSTPSRLKALIGKGERVPVMGAEYQEPEYLPAAAFQQFADRDEVSERLAHLLIAELKQAIVDPVADPWCMREKGLRLRDLILVVGEDEIGSATVDVD